MTWQQALDTIEQDLDDLESALQLADGEPPLLTNRPIIDVNELGPIPSHFAARAAWLAQRSKNCEELVEQAKTLVATALAGTARFQPASESPRPKMIDTSA